MAQRETKFRAWHKASKKMFEWSDFSINGRNNCIIHLTEGVFTTKNIDGNSVEIMQFTGLYDKDGKEIYEGDIMKIKLPMGGFWGNVRKEKTGAVIYEADCGGFIVQWEYSVNQYHERLGCDIAFEGEVVGNIYETG